MYTKFLDREVHSLKFMIRILNTEIRTFTTSSYYLTDISTGRPVPSLVTTNILYFVSLYVRIILLLNFMILIKFSVD